MLFNRCERRKRGKRGNRLARSLGRGKGKIRKKPSIDKLFAPVLEVKWGEYQKRKGEEKNRGLFHRLRAGLRFAEATTWEGARSNIHALGALERKNAGERCREGKKKKEGRLALTDYHEKSHRRILWQVVGGNLKKRG